MAELSGTNLSAKIVPFTTDDTFATHLAKYGQGGWRSVADTAERDGITADRREAGMAVYVISEKKVYILSDDLTTWTDLQTGGGDLGYTKDEIDGFLAAIEAQIDANADAIQKTREDYAQADADIMTIINAHAEQITTNKNDIDNLGDQVAEIEAKIPESASETNQLVTQTDLTNKKIEIMGEVNESVSELQTQITAQAAAIADKVDKAGDTMTGALNVPELNVATDEGTINLSITAGTATIATNNGLDIVAQTKFDTAPTTDDTTAWADVNATALVTKQQVTTALADAGGTDLPDQTGNSGKYLSTDGENLSWEKVNDYTAGEGLVLAQPFENDNYKQIEYIESTGDIYVDTGVLDNPNYEYKARFQPTNIDKSFSTLFGYLAGNITSAPSRAIRIEVQDGVKSIAIGYTDDGAFAGKMYTAGAMDELAWHNVSYNKTSVELDGAKLLEFNPYPNAFPAKMVLFGAWVGYSSNPTSGSGWSYRTQYAGKISSFEVYENTDGTPVLIHNFIPVKSKTTNEAGFYDTINDTFHPVVSSVEQATWQQGPESAIVIELEYPVPQVSLNAGKFLTNDGEKLYWADVASGGGSLPDQTDNAGKFLMTDGANVSWEPAIRNNSDDPDYSLSIGKDSENISVYSIAIGNEAKSQSDYCIAIGYQALTSANSIGAISIGRNAVVNSDSPNGIAIGFQANVGNDQSIAIGTNATANNSLSVAFGDSTTAKEPYCNAIGYGAKAYGYASTQIGIGSNYDTYTLKFREYTVIKQDGTIPYARLSTGTPSNGQVLMYDEDEDTLVWGEGGGGGMSEVNWGDITGSLINQTDLNTELQNIHSGIQDLEQDFSTSTSRLENDIQDAESRLQTQIDSLSAIGQFLAIWDCDTHNARYLDEGFEYQVGNYFIIGSIAGEGGVNYMPDGPTYSSTGFAVTNEDVKVSDMWFYDGEHWIYLANHERSIAVDADLDKESTNPVENKAVATAIEELQNRPTGVGVPQLASVDIDQIRTVEEAEERRLKYEDWKGRYSDIVVTLNLSKQDLLDKMYDLYITISRFKTNKNLTYNVDDMDYNYRQLSKFSVMNDMRIKTDMRLYCWRYVTDSSLPVEDERRWAYFYTRENYAGVQELLDENPNIGLWYDCGDNPVGYATCFNAVGWNYGYDAQTYYDDYNDGALERYEAGDISEFVNVKETKNFDYNVADYVTKMHCRKYTKDGQNYFFWSASWKAVDDEAVYAYLEDGALVSNGIPKYMDTLSEYTPTMTDFVAQGFELVENRPDLNYRRVIDPDMLIEALQEITFRGYSFGNDEAPYWRCYWFDYPVMPVMLKDCDVRTHKGTDGRSSRWKNLEKLVKNNQTHLLRDDLPLELKLPYDTYYLWMRFLSLQKRCAYGDPSDWNEGNGISNPMYPYQKHNLREGVIDYNILNKKAFGRPRSAYRNNDFAKICEYIQFNVCTPLDAASGSKSKATPIQKRLYITKTAQSGLRD